MPHANNIFDIGLTKLNRILRAMFEICLKRGWAIPARACLDLCKMVEKRMCVFNDPIQSYFCSIVSLGGVP